MAINPVEAVLLQGFTLTGANPGQQQIITQGYGPLVLVYISTQNRRDQRFSVKAGDGFAMRVDHEFSVKRSTPIVSRRTSSFSTKKFE